MKSILFETQSGKPCDKCSKCCEGWLTGNAYGFEFKPGTPCKFITGSGCGIYAARPEDPCKTFRCHWKTNPRMPDWMRPDLNGVITLVRYLGTHRYLVLHSTGQVPDPRVLTWADEWAESGGNVIFYSYDGVKTFSKNNEFIELVAKM
jgi:hypothetical protein